MHRHSSRLAIGFACAGHTYMHVLTALYLTVVLGLERAWQMPYEDLIRLWTIGSLLIGLGAPLAGWLGDRWRESWMMVAFFLITGGGAVGAGLADGPTSLTIGLATLGLGASIFHPVGMSWVVRHATRRGAAIGVLGIFGGIGVALAAVIAATLTDIIDWRAAFLIPGAVSIATGLALTACLVLGWIVDPDGDVAPAESRPSGRGAMIRTFVILSVTMVVGGLLFNGLQVAMPKWFEAQMTGLVGGSVLGIGGLVTLVYLIAALSQYFGGRMADRFPLKQTYAVGLLLQFVLLGVAASLADAPLLLVVTLVVFIGNGIMPAENMLLARYTPARHRGLAYGAKFVLAFGVGPLAVQLVAVTYGWTGAFTLLLMVLSAAGLIAWLAALALPRDRGPGSAPVAASVPAE
ncbi:MAG: MFS transporter [Inquilinaceae bacterium]